MSEDSLGVLRRLRRPGPPLGRDRPAAIGSIASSSQRFAAGVARPPAVRRTLAGPGTIGVGTLRDLNVRPPRWWTPERQEPGSGGSGDPAVSGPAGAGAAQQRAGAPAGVQRATGRADLPERGLRRMTKRIPTEQSWQPGAIAESLVSKTIPVRRMDEVTAAGPMLMQHDRARLVAPARRDPPPRPDGGGRADRGAGPAPGQSSGSGPRPAAPVRRAVTAPGTQAAAVGPRPAPAAPSNPSPSAGRALPTGGQPPSAAVLASPGVADRPLPGPNSPATGAPAARPEPPTAGTGRHAAPDPVAPRGADEPVDLAGAPQAGAGQRRGPMAATVARLHAAASRPPALTRAAIPLWRRRAGTAGADGSGITGVWGVRPASRPGWAVASGAAALRRASVPATPVRPAAMTGSTAATGAPLAPATAPRTSRGGSLPPAGSDSNLRRSAGTDQVGTPSPVGGAAPAPASPTRTTERATSGRSAESGATRVTPSAGGSDRSAGSAAVTPPHTSPALAAADAARITGDSPTPGPPSGAAASPAGGPDGIPVSSLRRLPGSATIPGQDIAASTAGQLLGSTAPLLARSASAARRAHPSGRETHAVTPAPTGPPAAARSSAAAAHADIPFVAADRAAQRHQRLARVARSPIASPTAKPHAAPVGGGSVERLPSSPVLGPAAAARASATTASASPEPIRRTSRVGSLLDSAFSAPVLIPPATSGGAGLGGPARPGTPGPVPAPRTPAAGAAGSPFLPPPGRPVRRARDARGGGSRSAPSTTSEYLARTAVAGPSAAALSRYVMAPPRISMRPGAPARSPAPPTPAVATDLVRRGGAQRPPSGPPSSLAAATAELFRAIAPAHANPTTTRPTEAAAVSEQIMRQQSGAAPDVRHAVVRRAITVDEVSTTTSPSGPAPLSRRDLDELVDQVVERIEQRVVDELERRGRRNIPEAF